MRCTESPFIGDAPFTPGSYAENRGGISDRELVRIHPFIDGNGRTARLFMNLYLLRHNYTLINLKGSNEAKTAYYKALETWHTDNRPEDFQQLVAEGEIASLKRYLFVLGAGEYEDFK